MGIAAEGSGFTAPMSNRLRTVTVTITLLAAAACGGADGDPEAATTADAAAGPAAPSSSPDVAAPAAPASDDTPSTATTDIPALDLIDVRTGEPVALRSLVPADKPLLFWFWAPH